MTEPARVSLLVPYRPDGAERDRLWAFLRARYEARFPSWEIVTAPGPEGPFSRTAAICDAAEQATGDVFAIVDADIWCEGLEDAVQRVASGSPWADPAELVVVRMTAKATDAVLHGADFSAAGASKPLRRVPCAGAVAISRAAFLRCPPDRRFVGWGGEATAWAHALERAFGPASVGERAPLFHLFHPPGDRKTSRRNQRLMEAYVEGTDGPTPIGQEPAMSGRPRIVILADVPTWAWAKKARALQAHLHPRFEISIVYSTEPGAAKVVSGGKYDLLHTFEVFQVSQYGKTGPLVTGITAHVWQTWERTEGKGTVRRWAGRARGVHANSKMLQAEMEAYLGKAVHYVPNGVDEVFYHRMRPRESSKLIVGFVGKPNPRKGRDIVAAACQKAGVELREVCRRSGDALPQEGMRDFYQGIHVLAVASDMDGTPNPALEAAACGCAVVSNKIGNMPEFIDHGRNGLFHDRSLDQLAEALWNLKQRPIEEVEEMGRAARRTVEEAWTWQRQAENYAALWNTCLGRTG